MYRSNLDSRRSEGRLFWAGSTRGKGDFHVTQLSASAILTCIFSSVRFPTTTPQLHVNTPLGVIPNLWRVSILLSIHSADSDWLLFVAPDVNSLSLFSSTWSAAWQYKIRNPRRNQLTKGFSTGGRGGILLYTSRRVPGKLLQALLLRTLSRTSPQSRQSLPAVLQSRADLLKPASKA